MIMLTIYDRITGQYSDPYTFVNLEDAKRKLVVAYGKNPFFNDLEVYRVGSFDNLKGLLLSHDKDFLFTIQALIAEVNDNAQA